MHDVLQIIALDVIAAAKLSLFWLSSTKWNTKCNTERFDASRNDYVLRQNLIFFLFHTLSALTRAIYFFT